MGIIAPAIYERLAQAYALQIQDGKITIGDVPLVPAKIKPRVEEIIDWAKAAAV